MCIRDRAIEKEAAKKDICMPVLIEVNVAGEESKFGLSVEEVLPFLEEISSYEPVSYTHLDSLLKLEIFFTDSAELRSMLVRT